MDVFDGFDEVRLAKNEIDGFRLFDSYRFDLHTSFLLEFRLWRSRKQ